MSKFIWWSIVVLGCGLVALIIYYALPKPAPAPVAAPPALSPVVQAPAAAGPQIRYQVPPQPPAKPLPALAVSDATLKNAAGELVADNSLLGLLQFQDFVRRVVATVDSLPRAKLAVRITPVKRASGRFITDGKQENLVIGAGNAARYALYLRLAETVDTGKLVALYIHFYPLFQQAYEELGFPKGYFNDRLVEVIDHLLAAPEITAPVKLVQPKTLFQFADPALEARSAGEKIMMRIGSENAARLKARLRDVREELLRQAPKR